MKSVSVESERAYLLKKLAEERKRHEGELARLLNRASAIGMYVPGANPFLYPGCFRGPFRASS
jgi:hypothetical protein